MNILEQQQKLPYTFGWLNKHYQELKRPLLKGGDERDKEIAGRLQTSFYERIGAVAAGVEGIAMVDNTEDYSYRYYQGSVGVRRRSNRIVGRMRGWQTKERLAQAGGRWEVLDSRSGGIGPSPVYGGKSKYGQNSAWLSSRPS
jgi:hypothetical protein